jgi:hypothetical protein
MNLFNECEGLAGEQLATAGLRLLVLRSAAFRAAFVRLLDQLSPHGPLLSLSHFSCYSEYGTRDEALGDGRLDLTVELDEVVIGIEVKLAAAFQPGQPTKYEEELRRVAGLLGKIRRKTIREFVVVLAPGNRRQDILPHLGAGHRFLEWEAIIQAFRQVAGADPFATLLFEDYERFLGDHLEFLPSFGQWAHHTRTTWEPRGTESQRNLLRKLRDLLPAAGGRLGSGATWVGYHFSPDGEGAPRSWIGFVPRTRLTGNQTDTGALMVVSSPRVLARGGAGFRKAPLQEPIWIDGVKTSDWEVLFDGQWNQPSNWINGLAEFLTQTDEKGTFSP